MKIKLNQRRLLHQGFKDVDELLSFIKRGFTNEDGSYITLKNVEKIEIECDVMRVYEVEEYED